jgi:hypothetical protein
MTGDSLLRRAGLALVPAAACCGQSTPPVTITYHLTFTEVSAQAPYAPVASPNGLLEPGEGARFEITASMSPPPGTRVTYDRPWGVGHAGAGYIGGFWSGDVNLTGDGGGAGAAGVWIVNHNSAPPGDPNRLGVLPPFDAGAPLSNGTPISGGASVVDIQPAQFGINIPAVNSASPTPAMWRGVWLPQGHVPRTIPFQLSLGSLGLPPAFFAVDDSISIPMALQAVGAFEQPLELHIVPAPATALVLGAAGFIVGRSRCRPPLMRS